MDDKLIQDRIRAFGQSEDAPGLDVAAIVDGGQMRRRRTMRLGAAVAVAALVVTGIAWATANRSPVGTDRSQGTVTAAPPEARPNARMAPACPPAGPDLVQSPSLNAPSVSEPMVATAGDVLPLYAVQRVRPASDRPITSVRFIIGTTALSDPPAGEGAGTRNVFDPKNQLATSPVTKFPKDLVSTEVAVPSTIPPGDYPLIMVTTWPGPSLCGTANGVATTEGVSVGKVATVTVRPR